MRSASQPPVADPKSSRNTWGVLPVVGLLVLLSAGGFWLGITRNARRDREAPLQVDPEYLDFGEVWVEDGFPWILPIKNTSSEVIEIVELRSSCACTSVVPTGLVIAPKETAKAQLTLDLTPGKGDDPMLPVRDFSVQVAGQVKGPGSGGVGWTVRGRIKTPVALSQWSINFGEVVQGIGFEDKSIEVTYLLPGTGVEVTCEHPFAACVVEPAENRPDTSHVRVILQEGLPLGEFSFPVRISARTSNEQSAGSVTLRVSGKVVGDFEFIPTTIAFHPRPIGESLLLTVVLSSRTGRPFVVETATPDRDYVSVERVTDSPVEGQMFRVAARIPDVGDHWAEIDFAINPEGSHRPVHHHLPVYCHGLPIEAPKERSNDGSPD